MLRAKKDGSAVAVAVVPLIISQLNCTAAVGMNERRYLEWIIERGVPCRKEGKLRLVDATTAVRYLAPSDDEESEDVDSTEDEIDRVLAAVGRRRTR